MFPEQTDWLCCPVTRAPLRLQIISTRKKKFRDGEKEVVWEGLLYSPGQWVYPVMHGVPRLIVEALYDYAPFLQTYLPDFENRKQLLEKEYAGLLRLVRKKNRHTKQSFSQEWGLYNYESDKTWDLDATGLVSRFLEETGETMESIPGKKVFDAGCGNGLLNQHLAAAGVPNLAMDFSLSILRAFERNLEPAVLYVQGDVEFPPAPFGFFDIVHSSGVLIATRNTELSLSCLEPCVKPGGKLSLWLYQPRQDFIHNLFNRVRKVSSRLPVKVQYYLYGATLLPVSYVVKRIKGNRQNVREMMIDILDWFSPQYRWEHEQSEAKCWLWKRNYHEVAVTQDNRWGFNLIGVKPSVSEG